MGGGFGATHPIRGAWPLHPQGSGASGPAPAPQESHSEDGGPWPALLPVAQPESCLLNRGGQHRCPGAMPSRLSLAQGAWTKAKAAVLALAGSRGRGLAAGGLLNSTTGTICSFAGDRGVIARHGVAGKGVQGRKRSHSPSWESHGVRRSLIACLMPPLLVSPVLGDVCGAGPVSLRGDGLHIHPAGHALRGAGLEVMCPRRGSPCQHGIPSMAPALRCLGSAALVHPGSAAA